MEKAKNAIENEIDLDLYNIEVGKHYEDLERLGMIKDQVLEYLGNTNN